MESSKMAIRLGDTGVIGDLNLSCFWSVVKVKTRPEWAETCMGGEEIGCEHGQLFAKVWLWCRGEEMWITEGFFCLIFSFFKG